ncbi:cysteine-rich receptor-like protein kinase 8 [Tanacetum coccineum]
MEIGLSTKRKLIFVKGTIPKPVVMSVTPENTIARAANVVDIEMWETCNNLVISWIMSSVCESKAKSVLFIGTASEIWTQLETRFSVSNRSRKYKLCKDTFGISQQGSSKEEQRLFQFLNGLDDCYSAQRSQLLLLNPLPSVENACAVIQQEDSQKYVFSNGLPVIKSTALFSKNAGKEKCSICGFKWNPQDKCWEKVKYPIWHHKYKAQGKQNQSRSKEFEKGRGNEGNLNQRKTAANVTSGSNSFTFTSEQFENLIRNVLKDMRPGATAGDCTNDEIEFVAGMICLNVATFNAFFHWIIGTGASDHMTPFCRDMINAKILEVLPKITLLNGDSSKITQIGQVNLKNGILLKDVLYVPTFKLSLLLVSKLTKDNNCIAIFFPNFFIIQDLRTKKVQGLGRKIAGLYHLLNVLVDQVDAQQRNEVENIVRTYIFDFKMKHVQCYDVSVNNTHGNTCLTCLMAKLTKLPYAYIDDYSRATWTYLMIHKSDAMKIVKAFLKFVKLQFETKTTCPDRPQQNGRVEKSTCIFLRIPSSVLQNKAPYEMLLKKVPDYSNLRVFGCFAVAANPSRVVDKFSPRGVPCVFLDYHIHQKGYKLYNLLTHNSFVSRDVVFHELIFPFDESSSQKFFQQMPVSMPNHTHPAVYDDCELEPMLYHGNQEVIQEEPVVPNTTSFDSQPVPTPSTIVNTKILVRRSTRTSKAPNLTKDFVAPTIKPAANQQDPKRFKEAVKDVGWCEAMNAELRALEENGTWDLQTYHQERRKLVMKGVDYEETFAPVAKVVTVRSLLARAAMNGWEITQIDLSNAFLHGDLFEEVYMQLPIGYVGQVSSALISFGYKQSKADYSLFTKKNAEDFTAILLYVDDLMITDLGDLHYFLGLKVTKSKASLFVSQKKYTMEMLQEVGVMHSRPYKLPMDPNLKLQANVGTPLQDPEPVYAKSNFNSYAGCEIPLKILNSPSQGILLTHHSKLKKQGVVSRSLAEVEYRAMAITSAIHIAANLVFHARTKHIEVDYHFVREKVQDGSVKPTYLHTSKQLADVFTKVLTTEQHHNLLNKLGVSTLDTAQLKGEYKDRGG